MLFCLKSEVALRTRRALRSHLSAERSQSPREDAAGCCTRFRSNQPARSERERAQFSSQPFADKIWQSASQCARCLFRISLFLGAGRGSKRSQRRDKPERLGRSLIRTSAGPPIEPTGCSERPISRLHRRLVGPLAISAPGNLRGYREHTKRIIALAVYQCGLTLLASGVKPQPSNSSNRFALHSNRVCQNNDNHLNKQLIATDTIQRQLEIESHLRASFRVGQIGSNRF